MTLVGEMFDFMTRLLRAQLYYQGFLSPAVMAAVMPSCPVCENCDPLIESEEGWWCERCGAVVFETTER